LHGLVRDDASEMDNLVTLRNWVHRRWSFDADRSAVRYDSSEILEAAQRGERFGSLEYAYVLVDVYRAMGFPARVVLLVGPAGSHAVVEVHARSTGAWMMMDVAHETLVCDAGTRQPLDVRAIVEAVVAGHASSLAAEVSRANEGGRDYLAWLAGYARRASFSARTDYGHVLDALITVCPGGDEGAVAALPPSLVAHGTHRDTVLDWSLVYPTVRGDAAAPALPLPAWKRVPDGALAGGARLTHEEALSDLDELVGLLESAHPDPYGGVGGPVAFARLVSDTRGAIPEDGLTVRQLARLLRPVAAAPGDGHTNIFLPQPPDARREPEVPIDLAPVEGKLLVRSVRREEDRAYIGAEVLAALGVPLKELLQRTRRERGADNEITNLVHLGARLVSPSALADLLGRDMDESAVSLTLRLPSGRVATVTFGATPAEPGPELTAPTRQALPALDASAIGWSLVGRNGKIGYLRIDSAARYREAFEAWRKSGYVSLLGEYLKGVAKQAAGDKPLGATEAERILQVPSASETIVRLRTALLEAHAKTLIVDVAKNDGGNSAIGYILTTLLLPEPPPGTVLDGYQLRRLSQLYFDSQSNDTLEAARERTSNALLRVGDIDFQEEEEFRRNHGQVPHDDRARGLAEAREAIPTFSAVLARDSGARWEGKIIVVTSADTYSAGLDIAKALVRRGAKVAGAPSSQAPNCFIDQLPYSLESSGLRGSISFKRSLSFPDDASRATILRPDFELTFAEWKRRGFDPNAAVTLAIEAAERHE
jgi:hypothetical protein